MEDRLKQYMKSKRIKQYEIAQVLGITQRSVSKKMRGSSDFKLGEARKIAKAWKMEPTEIVNVFFGEGN